MNTNNVTESQAFKTAFGHHMAEINVCLPGEIVKIIDYEKRKISVKPEIQRELLDSTIIEPPVIENVPLLYYGTSKAVLDLGIEKGDKVILVFSQRALENWLSKGKLTTPGDRRTFDISDAFAIPCIQAFKSSHTLIKDTDIVTLNMAANKKFNIKNAVEDLATLMDDLLQEIINIQTVGSPPQHVLAPASIANFTVIKTRIAQLLEEA